MLNANLHTVIQAERYFSNTAICSPISNNLRPPEVDTPRMLAICNTYLMNIYNAFEWHEKPPKFSQWKNDLNITYHTLQAQQKKLSEINTDHKITEFLINLIPLDDLLHYNKHDQARIYHKILTDFKYNSSARNIYKYLLLNHPSPLEPDGRVHIKVLFDAYQKIQWMGKPIRFTLWITQTCDEILESSNQ